MTVDTKIKKISELLLLRNKEWPVRGKVWYEIKNEIGELYKLLRKEVRNDFQPDLKNIQKINHFIENPVFICGNQKSGTTLLSQLLDGHPNLLCLPGDSRYVKKYFSRKKTDTEEAVKDWLHRLISPTGQEPNWPLGKNTADYVNFISYVFYFLKQGNDFFISLLSAVYTAFSKEKDCFFWVEKTTQNELFAEKLIKKYPKSKFIHILRNPIVNIASLKKHHTIHRSRKRFNIIRISMYLRYLMEKAEKNYLKYGQDKYLIIKYEDLVNQNEKVTEQICKILNIKHHSVLHIPTVFGIEATANSMNAENRVRGEIRKDNANLRWTKDLTHFEKSVVINILFASVKKFKYENWNSQRILNYKNIIFTFVFNILYKFYRIYRHKVDYKKIN